MKNGLIVVVLLGVGYGVYYFLTDGPEPKPPPGVDPESPTRVPYHLKANYFRSPP